MKLSSQLKVVILIFFFLLSTILILSPNPFGNNTDAIGDESLFLSNSLSAIKNKVLPGWYFSNYGNFYGGPQIYLDTLLLLPVIGIIKLFSGNNLLTQINIALNTGQFLYFLRVINNLVLLTVIGGVLYLYIKNKWPNNFGYKLLLLFFLLFSNSLFVGIIHTAKVWNIFIVLEIILGLIVIAYEKSLAANQNAFLKKNVYIGILSWLTLLIICQNIAGIITILWIIYALFLKHFKIDDFFAYFKKNILFFLLFIITQISFFYHSFILFF